MPATFVTASRATFTIAGTDYACQVTKFDAGLTDPTPTGGNAELTACGDTVPADSTDDYAARPTLEFVHDWTAAGLSHALAENVGATVALVVELDTDQSAQHRNYSFDVIVPPVPDEWTPGKLERAVMTFAATTAVGPLWGAAN